MVSTGLLLICSMALSDISKQQTDTRRLECEISIEDQVVAKKSVPFIGQYVISKSVTLRKDNLTCRGFGKEIVGENSVTFVSLKLSDGKVSVETIDTFGRSAVTLTTANPTDGQGVRSECYCQVR